MRTLITFFLSIVFLASFARAAEGPLNPGLRMSSGADLIGEPVVKDKKPVFVFIANDVQANIGGGFHQNVSAITSALKNYEKVDEKERLFLDDLVKRIPADLEAFNLNVDQERDHLIQGICRKDSLIFPASLIVFRNSGSPAVEHEDAWELRVPYEYCRVGGELGDTVRSSMKIVINGFLRDHFLSVSQPFTNRNAFNAMMRTLRKVFPEEQHRYLLVAKSRSDANHFFLPWFEADVTKVDPAEIATAVLKARAELTERDGVTAKKGQALYRPLNDVLKQLAPYAFFDFLTTGKVDVLETLASLGGGDPRQGAYFSSVVVSASDSQLELASDELLKRYAKPGDYSGMELKNIGKYYSRKETGKMESLEFHHLFGPFVIPASVVGFDARTEAWLKLMSKGSRP